MFEISTLKNVQTQTNFLNLTKLKNSSQNCKKKNTLKLKEKILKNTKPYVRTRWCPSHTLKSYVFKNNKKNIRYPSPSNNNNRNSVLHAYVWWFYGHVCLLNIFVVH